LRKHSPAEHLVEPHASGEQVSIVFGFGRPDDASLKQRVQRLSRLRRVPLKQFPPLDQPRTEPALDLLEVELRDTFDAVECVEFLPETHALGLALTKRDDQRVDRPRLRNRRYVVGLLTLDVSEFGMQRRALHGERLLVRA
jgi:hypothetical protein